jgi:hypothetical protein
VDLAERLETAGFSTAPAQNPRFRLVYRGELLCLLDVRANQPGSVMRMTASGLASVVWRGDAAVFVGRGFEEAASAEALGEICGFEADLRRALGLVG